MPDLAASARQMAESMPSLLYDTVEDAAAAHRRRVAQNVAFFRDNPEGIDARLDELRQEWDADRALYLASAGLSGAGLWLGLTGSRLWLVLPLAMSVAQLAHGATGQGPALDFVRRLGFRTREEIDAEIEALRELRPR